MPHYYYINATQMVTQMATLFAYKMVTLWSHYGHLNGYPNGHPNGYPNGYTNGILMTTLLIQHFGHMTGN